MSKNPKMRAVTTAQSMRRSYNRVIDGDGGNNPYQSMYAQAFGTGTQGRESGMYSTPQKSLKVKQTYQANRASRGANTATRIEDQLR